MTVEQERESAGLMRLAQAGDQTAYASLLVLLTSATRQFARARLGGVPWIDDVVQETLLAVHRARQTYDPGRPFAPWFYAVASSPLIDVIRRERRVISHEIAGDSAAGADWGKRRLAMTASTSKRSTPRWHHCRNGSAR